MQEISINIFEKGDFNFLDNIIVNLNKEIKGVKFKKVPQKGPFNVIDPTTLLGSHINIVINNPYINTIICSGIYDLVKMSLISIWKNIRDKRITIIKSGNEIKENQEVNLAIKIGNLEFKMPNNLSDELKEKFMDNAFELARKYYSEENRYIVLYDDKNHSFELKEYNELLHELIKRKIEESKIKNREDVNGGKCKK
ncbi:hypothetical protein ACED96_06785 [Clostridium thermobutyricum]